MEPEPDAGTYYILCVGTWREDMSMRGIFPSLETADAALRQLIASGEREAVAVVGPYTPGVLAESEPEILIDVEEAPLGRRFTGWDQPGHVYHYYNSRGEEVPGPIWRDRIDGQPGDLRQSERETRHIS